MSKDMELSKEHIDRIFDEATNQIEALVRLYRAAFPDWDDIKKVNGWPTVSDSTNLYISQKFVYLDKKYHWGECIPGGLWLNNGFRGSPDMADWLIDVDTCEVVYA